MPALFLGERLEELSAFARSLTCLLSNVAMADGCYLIGVYEGRGELGVR